MEEKHRLSRLNVKLALQFNSLTGSRLRLSYSYDYSFIFIPKPDFRSTANFSRVGSFFSQAFQFCSHLQVHIYRAIHYFSGARPLHINHLRMLIRNNRKQIPSPSHAILSIATAQDSLSRDVLPACTLRNADRRDDSVS